MKFPIGVTITAEGERIVYIDLENQPHILVGGITGSGKTCFIKCLLTAMCLQDIELIIIDMKMGGDYNVFKYYKYLIAFIKTIEDAERQIEDIKKIMCERFRELDRTDCKDFKDYNKKYKNAMKPIVVLIEEYTMLSDDKSFTKQLNVILAQSRAVNIKIILSVQRPCGENLDAKLKANLNNTVAFKVRNSYNSEILLDRGDMRAITDIHGTGEAILFNDNQDVLFKSFFLEDREIKRRIFMKCNMGNKPKERVREVKELSLI